MKLLRVVFKEDLCLREEFSTLPLELMIDEKVWQHLVKSETHYLSINNLIKFSNIVKVFHSYLQPIVSKNNIKLNILVLLVKFLKVMLKFFICNFIISLIFFNFHAKIKN